MISHLAALLMPGAIFLTNNAEPDLNIIYSCIFDGRPVVIEHREAASRATVQVGGLTRQYIFDQRKLVATEAGLPTYYFQAELKRWKRLNDNGETVETTVCKMSRPVSASGSAR